MPNSSVSTSTDKKSWKEVGVFKCESTDGDRAIGDRSQLVRRSRVLTEGQQADQLGVEVLLVMR